MRVVWLFVNKQKAHSDTVGYTLGRIDITELFLSLSYKNVMCKPMLTRMCALMRRVTVDNDNINKRSNAFYE